jgi:hypothetical protein
VLPKKRKVKRKVNWDKTLATGKIDTGLLPLMWERVTQIDQIDTHAHKHTVPDRKETIHRRQKTSG